MITHFKEGDCCVEFHKSKRPNKNIYCLRYSLLTSASLVQKHLIYKNWLIVNQCTVMDSKKSHLVIYHSIWLHLTLTISHEQMWFLTKHNHITVKSNHVHNTLIYFNTVILYLCWLKQQCYGACPDRYERRSTKIYHAFMRKWEQADKQVLFLFIPQLHNGKASLEAADSYHWGRVKKVLGTSYLLRVARRQQLDKLFPLPSN